MKGEMSDTSDTSQARDESTSAKPGRTPVEPSRRDAVEDWLTLFVRMLGLPASETEAVRDELEDHLRSRVDDLLITGVSEPEAVRRAVAELGETATLAQGFRNARRTPRRRTAMYALFAIAGSALVLSSTAVLTGGAGSVPAPGTGAIVQPEVPAEFGDSLRRYSISGLVPADGPLDYSAAAAGLLEVIFDLVARDDWEANGGDQGRASIVGNTLFVDATPELHEGVEWVLSVLEADAERIAQERAERVADQHRREAAETEAFLRTQKEVEARMAAQRAERIHDLRRRSEELLERLVDLRSRQAVSTPKLDHISHLLATTPDDEALIAAMKAASAEDTRVGVELEDVEVRLDAVRAALINLEMAEYAVSPGAAPMPTSWRAAPAPAAAATVPASPSSR